MDSNFYLSIFFGYFLAIIVGDIVVSNISKICWNKLKEDWDELTKEEQEGKTFVKQTENNRIIKRILGITEIILYITTIIMHHPEGILAWLTLKAVVSWQSFNQDKRYVSPNVFLLGNILNVIFAFLGAFYIKVTDSNIFMYCCK